MEDLLSLSLSSLLFLEDLKPSGEVSIWNSLFSEFHKASSVAHVVCVFSILVASSYQSHGIFYVLRHGGPWWEWEMSTVLIAGGPWSR